ncbi:Histone deacetylase complex subunit CTI6 [Mycena kentingensis (nom. inval.)]|nr:Histone deacetylase complex subunit CTI6 [Mycena kentingensis (nom. inval.)]
MSPPPSPTRRRSYRPFSPTVPNSPDSAPRGKRPKQEDVEATVDGQDPSIPSSASSTSNGRASNGSASRPSKRKPKEKNQARSDDAAAGDDSTGHPEDEDGSGVTRCICGREDDTDAGEFMVQCETCKVWQHGLCMGYDSEAQLHDDDYYCEQCRPDFHADNLKKSRRKPRHSSTNGHQAQRQSRSHSPSQLKQPSKRRNTMNSRDAAFDENLKEILDATAAEANVSVQENGHVEPEDEAEAGPPNRKKRKRNEEDAPPKKRTRSASSASDPRMASAAPREESPPPPPKAAPKSAPKRRGGGRKVVHQDMEGEEVILPAPSKRGGPRAKAGAAKRAAAVPNQERRAAPNGHSTANNQYRNSHAYAVAQQPMHASWNLPDYLSHLEQMLPTDIPQPLEVLSGGPSSSGSRGASTERTMERGVKVKWPSKRMSVGDMNKRVRALVEWVGREQASASERNRRRIALEAALQDEYAKDAVGRLEMADEEMAPEPIPRYDDTQAVAAMKMMEELMAELINFEMSY